MRVSLRATLGCGKSCWFNRRPLVPRSVSAKTYAVESVDIRLSSPLPATTHSAGQCGQDILGPPPRPAHGDRGRRYTVIEGRLCRQELQEGHARTSLRGRG